MTAAGSLSSRGFPFSFSRNRKAHGKAASLRPAVCRDVNPLDRRIPGGPFPYEAGEPRRNMIK
ncbi:MAG: hypothetical protein C6P37_01550 [Caldibacillus debilis]|uniref:Uncharacterized protein n=1 Tax=Caldibacillus debilis TaxID=301148 RepID=A0A3E0K8F1_9BACI|nr:hypothetical protein [Bacillaceae bacterium]MBY6271174.1 hypothetical protein [Bacillaceae bacterium]REJ23763.1 MAG: hypothetical protein C6W56_15160 [Caldibacillus debilis]REJ31350.1 MAG: hypothetical protein C6P37_01550 [Caldibacillus debilis]